MINFMSTMNMILFQINLKYALNTTTNKREEGYFYIFFSILITVFFRQVFILNYQTNLYECSYNELLCPDLPNCSNENC